MKKTAFLFLLFLLWISPAKAHVLDDLWAKYVPRPAAGARTDGGTPGRDMFAVAHARGSQVFLQPWKYRGKTYELHDRDSRKLAASIYGLALHAGDISPTLPREKFLGGVLGFHYHVGQICAWLNDAMARKQSLSAEENAFAGLLLHDGVLVIANGVWRGGGKISHVLAAAPGKKKTFLETLRHERLHVYWDEDEAFRTRETEAWQNLPESERRRLREKMKNYNQNNERQLIEEWAVNRAEKSYMPLD